MVKTETESLFTGFCTKILFSTGKIGGLMKFCNGQKHKIEKLLFRTTYQCVNSFKNPKICFSTLPILWIFSKNWKLTEIEFLSIKIALRASEVLILREPTWHRPIKTREVRQLCLYVTSLYKEFLTRFRITRFDLSQFSGIFLSFWLLSPEIESWVANQSRDRFQLFWLVDGNCWIYARAVFAQFLLSSAAESQLQKMSEKFGISRSKLSQPENQQNRNS